MRELVGLISRKLIHEFIQNKIVGRRSIISRKNKRMTKMSEIAIQGRNETYLLNLLKFAQEDGRQGMSVALLPSRLL